MKNHNILDIKSLLLALILGLLITKGFEINHALYTSLLISGFYIFFLCLLNRNNNIVIKQIDKKSQFNKYNKNTPKHTEKEQFSSRNNVFYPKKTDINKSPFEGLFPKQLMNRLNYLFYVTSHPFKPKSFTDYVYSKNNNIPKSVKHLEVSRQYYPQLTEDQVNFNDCMNFPHGDPKSCNQGNDKWEAENSILTSGISTFLPIKFLYLTSFGLTAMAVSPIIVSGRVVAIVIFSEEFST